MRVIDTSIPDIKIFEPQVFGDSRGFFMETFRASWFEELGQNLNFVQDNHSMSSKGVLRGLHYQIRQPQGKLIRITSGEVFDVAVDLRSNSPTFGRHVAVILSAENKRMCWIPPGFAHGFLVLSDSAEFQYKCSEYYAPEHEHCLLWNDPALGIDWPVDGKPELSEKDKAGKRLAEAALFCEQ